MYLRPSQSAVLTHVRCMSSKMWNENRNAEEDVKAETTTARSTRSADSVDMMDEAALRACGYKQEFKRSFNPIEVFGLGFSIIGLFPSIA